MLPRHAAHALHQHRFIRHNLTSPCNSIFPIPETTHWNVLSLPYRICYPDRAWKVGQISKSKMLTFSRLDIQLAGFFHTGKTGWRRTGPHPPCTSRLNETHECGRACILLCYHAFAVGRRGASSWHIQDPRISTLWPTVALHRVPLTRCSRLSSPKILCSVSVIWPAVALRS